MGFFTPDSYDHLKDPPLWKKDIRRSKQSSTSFVQPFSIFRQGLFNIWRYSIWQAVLPELLVWLLLFFIVSFVYRFSGDRVQDRLEAFFVYCRNFQALIPLTFILGFYVSQVYTRWWSQWQTIPWIGRIALIIHDLDDREDDQGLHIRWTFMRWLLLGMGISFQRVSTSFRKLYPDMYSFKKLGLVTDDEEHILESCEASVEMCFVWASDLLRRQERDRMQHVTSTYHMRLLREEVIQWRTSNAILRGFNNHPTPIVMVNIIGFAVYVYFLAAIFSRQFFLHQGTAPSTSPRFRDGSLADYYLPWFSMIEFIFYVGWFKVSAMMYDPFSAHGCEHVLQRVWDEEISWARQGAAFRNWGQMPPILSGPQLDETFNDVPYGLDPSRVNLFQKSAQSDAQELGLGDEVGTYLFQQQRHKSIDGRELRSRHSTVGSTNPINLNQHETGLQEPLLQQFHEPGSA